MYKKNAGNFLHKKRKKKSADIFLYDNNLFLIFYEVMFENKKIIDIFYMTGSDTYIFEQSGIFMGLNLDLNENNL